MNQILSLSKVIESSSFVFCWDSRLSHRRKLYPNYKNKPPKTKEESEFEKFAFLQFIELRKFTLPHFGFKNSFIQTGLEADDIIAAITQNYDREFIIVSGDGDLYQLLNENVSMYSTKKKKLYTDKDFIKEYDITPKEWVKVKQIAGCRSDTVEGISGVAEKRAIQYLKNDLNEKTKAYQNIEKGKDIIKRNEALVKLPFEGTKIPKLINGEQFLLCKFYEITDKYGFRSYQQINKMQEWVDRFGMV